MRWVTFVTYISSTPLSTALWCKMTCFCLVVFYFIGSTGFTCVLTILNARFIETVFDYSDIGSRDGACE